MANQLYTVGGKILTHKGLAFDTPNPIWNGLQSYWRFNETTGIVAYDSGANGYNANVSGSFDSGGKSNYCVLINASGEQVQLGSTSYYNFERTDSFSYSTWIKREAVGGTNILLSKQYIGDTTYRGQLFFFLSSNNKLHVEINSSANLGNRIVLDSATAFTSTSDWYHIVWTYAGTSLASGCKLYVNGNNDSFSITTDALSGTIVNSNYFTIGNRVDASFHVNAKIDEFGVWNRVLSQAEVTQLYNSGNGLFY